MTSLHKLFAHILGIPYPNVVVANAALPLDLFTSTPDYTPYTYGRARGRSSCDVQTDARRAGAHRRRGTSPTIDEQPGLDAQVFRCMRGEQLTEPLPPR